MTLRAGRSAQQHKQMAAQVLPLYEHDVAPEMSTLPMPESVNAASVAAVPSM